MARGRRLTLDEFIEKACVVHGLKYDYTKSIWGGNTKTHLIISCAEHGDFNQTPANHLAGSGCKRCGLRKANKAAVLAIKSGKRKTKGQLKGPQGPRKDPSKIIDANRNRARKTHNTKTWLEKAKLVHGALYDYKNAKYSGWDQKVEIFCPKHGPFQQKSFLHLNGHGCPFCANSSKSFISQQWLDSFGNPNISREIKLNDLGFKVDGFDPTTNTVYEFHGDYWHGNPSIYPEGINRNNGKSFQDLYMATLERDEKIRKSGYNLITIWEAEYVSRS